MSLQRVGSLETFVNVPAEGLRSRRGSASSAAASERARKLTFNPLPESWDPVFEDEDDGHLHLGQSRGAFEVPRWKRIRKWLFRIFVTMDVSLGKLIHRLGV